MASDLTDSEVISASLEDPGRFGAIFERHFDRIYAYAARRLGDDKASDVAADAFIVAFRRRRDYDLSRHDALPWLYGITIRIIRHHRVAEFRRLRSLQRPGEDLPDVTAADADGRLDAQLALPQVAKALNRLSAADRETLLLVAWGDLTYRDISIAMGVPLGTVRSRLNRARTRLQTALPHLALDPTATVVRTRTEEGNRG